MKYSKWAAFLLCTVVLFLVGCGGVLDATIGGAVTGLSGGTEVSLLDNGTDQITVSANGNFTFDAKIEAGSNYNVTVYSQPIGETCTVSDGSGSVTQNSGDVTNVSVYCTANTPVGDNVLGSVSGLATGASVTLLDNGGDSLTVKANGSFVFATPIRAGSTYSVTVSANPTGQTCSVTNAAGVIPETGTITTVIVTCS
jgi:hypothetical protein